MGQYKKLLVYISLGVLSGALDKWADETRSVLGDMAGSILAGLGTYPGLWLSVLVLIAWLNRDDVTSAIRHGVAYFVSLCVGYYLFSQLAFGYSGLGVVVFWLAASVTLVPATVSVVVWMVNMSAEAPAWQQFWLHVASGLLVAIPLAAAATVIAAVGWFSSPHMGDTFAALAQVVFAMGICFILTKKWKRRVSSMVLAVALVWPVLGLFDVLWLTIRGSSMVL